MGYMQEVDKWLDGVLADMPQEPREEAKRKIRAKVLESYHNGRAAVGGDTPPQQQQERRQEPRRKGRYTNQPKNNYGR